MKIIIPINWKTKSLTNKQRIPSNVQIRSIKISKIIISNKSHEVNRQNKKYKPSIVPVSFYCFLISEWPPPSPPDVILLKERKREKKGKKKKDLLSQQNTKKENLIIFTERKMSNQATYSNSEKRKKNRQTFYLLIYIFLQTLTFFFFSFFVFVSSEATHASSGRPISRCVSPAWTGRVLMDYSFERRRKSKNPHASSRPWEAVMPDRVCCSTFRQTC